MNTPRQTRDPRQAMHLAEEPIYSARPPARPAREPFIAVAPDSLADAMVETASGIFGLIRRDDLPAEVAVLVDDWRMDYATIYIPGRLAATEATVQLPAVPPETQEASGLSGPFLNRVPEDWPEGSRWPKVVIGIGGLLLVLAFGILAVYLVLSRGSL